MSEQRNKIKLFEEKQVRAVWDDEAEKWWFSVADVCAILAESADGRKYWSVLKTRLKKEGSELATNCSQLKKGQEYAVLTDLMSRTWSGMNTREYKKYKGLKKENLRDNMTNTELVLNMLAEVAATDISIVRQPIGFNESAAVAEEGAKAAKAARVQIEKSTGKSVVSSLKADIKRLRYKK